jgi:hypothetical protein
MDRLRMKAPDGRGPGICQEDAGSQTVGAHAGAPASLLASSGGFVLGPAPGDSR